MDKVDQPASRPLWVDAAAIVAVVVTLILAARQLRPLVEAAAFLARTGETVIGLPTGTWLRAVAWVAVGIAIFARWRTAVLLGAWSAVLYEVAVLATSFTGGRRSGASLDLGLWPLLLALTAAALLSVASPVDRGLDHLTRRGRRLLVAAASTATLTVAAIPLLGEPSEPSQAGFAAPTFEPAFVVSSRLSAAVAALTFVVVLALAVAAVTDLGGAVRRRVFTLMAAGVVGYATIHLGLPRPFGVWDGQVVSAPAQTMLLVLAPGLVLGAGLYLIRASERAARPRLDKAREPLVS
jgi:hypothetical protein